MLNLCNTRVPPPFAAHNGTGRRACNISAITKDQVLPPLTGHPGFFHRARAFGGSAAGSRGGHVGAGEGQAAVSLPSGRLLRQEFVSM